MLRFLSRNPLVGLETEAGHGVQIVPLRDYIHSMTTTRLFGVAPVAVEGCDQVICIVFCIPQMRVRGA